MIQLRVRRIDDKGAVVDEQLVDVADPPADDTSLAQLVAKAQAILADPVNAPDFTAGQQKVLRATTVVALARMRGLV